MVLLAITGIVFTLVMAIAACNGAGDRQRAIDAYRPYQVRDEFVVSRQLYMRSPVSLTFPAENDEQAAEQLLRSL